MDDADKIQSSTDIDTNKVFFKKNLNEEEKRNGSKQSKTKTHIIVHACSCCLSHSVLVQYCSVSADVVC